MGALASCFLVDLFYCAFLLPLSLYLFLSLSLQNVHASSHDPIKPRTSTGRPPAVALVAMARRANNEDDAANEIDAGEGDAAAAVAAAEVEDDGAGKNARARRRAAGWRSTEDIKREGGGRQSFFLFKVFFFFLI